MNSPASSKPEAPKPKQMIAFVFSFTHEAEGDRKEIIKQAWEKVKDLPNIAFIDARPVLPVKSIPQILPVDERGNPINVWGVPVPLDKLSTEKPKE